MLWACRVKSGYGGVLFGARQCPVHLCDDADRYRHATYMYVSIRPVTLGLARQLGAVRQTCFLLGFNDAANGQLNELHGLGRRDVAFSKTRTTTRLGRCRRKRQNAGFYMHEIEITVLNRSSPLLD